MDESTKKHGIAVREKMLRAIIGYIEEHGYAPTYQEIGEMVGLKSKSSVHDHIMTMLRLGVIETDEKEALSPRAIRVPGYNFVKKSEAERLTPKEVISNSSHPGVYEYSCPTCKTNYIEDRIYGTTKYCSECGQAIKLIEEHQEGSDNSAQKEKKRYYSGRNAEKCKGEP